MRIIDITKIYRDKIVIPKEIRKSIKLVDGDKILWYEENGVICIKKIEEEIKEKKYIVSGL